ncbi:hypothetical protein VOLCADRAFT_92624 [Volvox carteri f. nagariensis]|uniref:Uncharacterized protein n=1 Tax=Volvox carteri f. nagariensis TaxID=3068 RepID=D8U049_VOLCA|nr:uncharacterized protein VOLCADRAFT_92624 [Volvox carteri f. nagariensis]EFJ46875.1 hypothetical protein VOLCADRAFT_92624 [Volvox carteri f. nagariensis]|eukprot:XP_002952084.1 hypothetical protein VOLCADRAFT_92624 [Volvox carteri f. nagariensis]
MRKRALRLLLLGPKSYFWEHAARSTYTQRQSATTSPATPPHDSSLESSPLATSTIINPTKAIRHLKPSSATSYDSAKKCRTFSSGMAPPSCSPVPGDSAPVTATTTVSAPAEALAAPRAATTAGSVAAKSGGRHPSTVKQSRSTGHYRGGGASLADEPTEPLPLPQSSQCAVAVGTRNPHQHRDVRYAATAPPPDLNRSSSRWGAGAWGVVGSRARGRAHGIAAAPAALGASVITEFSSRARPPAEFRTHRSSSSSRPATLAAPPDRASDQRLRDQHHQHPVGDILATMRQAGQSRNLQLRRRAAASLVAWVNRQWRAPEPADAATTVATLPAAAAVELAVLCSDLSLTDTAVWDMLLRRVAAEAAVPAAEVEAAATAGVVLHERFVVAEGSGAYGLPPTLRGTRGSAGPVEPHDQRRAALVQVWEVALVMHAAAAQHLDGEGAPRLAALLYAAGELSPPMTLTPPPERPTGHRDMRHYERHSAVEMGAWAETVLGEPGAVEAALRELLAVVRQTQPYGVGGVLGHSAQLSVAWSSAPDLHRHGRLSRAVWDALPFTAALVEPNVPWVAAAALLSDICRLAAATFYTPTDYWANELAASPGSCSTNGGRSRRRVSSNNSNRRTNSSYSPHANDLLLLVRAMEVLRGQSATATATAIAAAGSGRQLLALAAGGPGLSLPSTTTATLESIVLASASAHLRRVTGQLAAEGRQPGIDGRCGGGSDETGSDVLDLPVSARLTEYLARRSRIPDWHLIWRLVRHQNAAAELVPQPWRMQQGDDGGGEAAAWPVRGAAAAAERVLRSDAEDLQRWCWPRTAVRLAEALAESTWLGSAETTGADATGDCDAAAAAGAAAIAAAAEKLLLHAAPAAVTGTRSDDLAATLAWLRSAAVLEGGRRRHRHSPQRGGGDGGNGVLPAAIASVAAHAESQLLLLLLKQEHHHQPEAQRWPRRQQAASTAPATSVAAATASRELSSVFDLDADTTSGSCCGIASSSSSSGGDGVSTGSGDLELPALPGGSQGGDATELAGVIEAVGSLLAADTRLGELQESGLPASLMVACLQVLAASAASAASASAASSAAVEWLPAMDFPCVGSPPGGPGGALGAGSNAVGGGGGSGGGCIRGAVLRNAAAQALDWLATRRRYVPVGTTHTSLLPLLTAVTTSPPPPPPPPPRPPLREPTAPPPATNTHVGAGAAEGDSGVGGNGGTGLSVSAVKRFTSRQYGQQPHHHVATALLAVSRLIADEEAAAAAEEEEGEGEDGADPEMRSMRLHQLQAAARQLAEDLRRAPSERLPLPQLADLCTSLRELGLMDAQLLLHLTQQHRERRQQQGNMWNSRPYAAAAAAAGGAGCAAVAAAQLLSLAAAVLCSTAAAAAPPAAGSSSPISARVRAAAAAAAASAPLTRSQLADAAAARVVWLAPVLMSRRDGLEAVPPEMLVAACCAVHDLGAAAGGGGGGAVQWYGSADTCLAELGSVVTRRLLETGVDGLLLHQLAALSRCLAQLPAARGAPGNRSQEGPRDRTRDRDPGQAIQAAAAEAAVVQGGERQSGGGWLPRWWSWRPPLERPAQADSGECPDRREGRDSRSGLSRLVGGGGDGGSGGGGGVNTTGEAAAGAMPQGLAALGTGGRGLDESRSDVELRERVQEALLCRTTRRGDAYEAPTDVACRALRDLAVAGTLRTLPTLAASLVDGLVFRLAEDAGVDDLAAVAAALAAGGSDPWVLHCGIRGVLDELSSGLQGRLRLQPEEVTTTHLMVMAADMYDVAMAAVAAGGSSSAAAAAATLAAGSAGVLRVLSRALAARAEQLLPDQVLAVAALFSAPRLRDTHLLQRLTEAAASAASACTAPSAAAAAASAGPPEQRTYTAEQLLSLAQSMYSAGLRDQHMFAPLARALRARVEPRNPRDGSPGDSCTCTADVGMDARTLQSAASLLRALRLNADADVLQQAFVAQVRGRDQLPPSSAPAMQR